MSDFKTRKVNADKANMHGISFKEYMEEVDEYLETQCGMGHEDLPDFDWNDLYTDDIPAEEAADMLLGSEEYGE